MFVCLHYMQTCCFVSFCLLSAVSFILVCLFVINKFDKYFGYFILVAGPFKCLFVCLFVLVLFFFKQNHFDLLFNFVYI